jgi:hypothetical protein
MNTRFIDHAREKKMRGRSPLRSLGGVLPCLIAVFLLSLLPGCGPTNEEMMAMDQARLQREARESQEAEARRQAEQARQEKIRATVTACSEAAAQGRLDDAMARCQEALGHVQRYDDQDRQVRETIIKIARAMPSPPPVPEETVRSMARGEAKVKMGGAGSFEAAAKEMEQAVMAAPWLADAYFNLGVVQEKAEMFGRAIQNFRLYLLAAPQSPNAKTVQAKIYALEVMGEEQEKMQSLAGSWRTKGESVFKVTVEGRKVRIGGGMSTPMDGASNQMIWRVFDLEKRGASLEGMVTVAKDNSHNCAFPTETVPVSGVIGEDGNTINLTWRETSHRWTWQGSVCTGISSLGKIEWGLALVRATAPASGASAVRESSAPAAKKKPMSK